MQFRQSEAPFAAEQSMRNWLPGLILLEKIIRGLYMREAEAPGQQPIEAATGSMCVIIQNVHRRSFAKTTLPTH